MHRIIEKINRIQTTLPRAEKRIADALLENPEAIEGMTLSRISKESGASEASIVRFARRIGYDGYTALKEAFTAANHENAEETITIGVRDDMATILEKLYKNSLDTLSETLEIENDYDAALGALLGAEKISFFATGDAYAAVRLSYIKFKRIGASCSAEEDVMLQMIAASNLTKRDVAVAVSYEGRSRNVVDALRIAKARGATTISITRRDNSPLLRHTDIRLRVSANDLTVGRDKVTRRISDQFVLEALYLGYESRRERDYKERMRNTQEAIDSNKI